jgi:hypothetical protein
VYLRADRLNKRSAWIAYFFWLCSWGVAIGGVGLLSEFFLADYLGSDPLFHAICFPGLLVGLFSLLAGGILLIAQAVTRIILLPLNRIVLYFQFLFQDVDWSEDLRELQFKIQAKIPVFWKGRTQCSQKVSRKKDYPIHREFSDRYMQWRGKTRECQMVLARWMFRQGIVSVRPQKDEVGICYMLDALFGKKGV